MRVRELFDQCATEYDQDRRKLVPFFDDFYGTVLSMIPFERSAPLRVLDLGTGTGLLTAMVAGALPAARFHLTDISPAMLAQAQQRFTGTGRITFALQDHLQLALDSAYDLVISALSIHHLEHEAKRQLFHRVFQAIRPGGMFINADQAAGATAQEEEEYERRWIEDVTRNGVSSLSLEKAQERMREDNNATLAAQMQWLCDAGFQHVSCGYERARFVVYGGYRP